MQKKLTTVLCVATFYLACPLTDPMVHAESSMKAKVAVKSKGHPDKEGTAVAVHQTSKPKPAPKVEKAPKTMRLGTSWVPGDYYWDGADWQWSEGYSLDQPWSEALWVPGHWSDRFWGWTWVPGYWF